MILIPVARESLLDKLNRGIGDVAGANLTITSARQQQVAFTDPVYPGVHELLVTGPAAAAEIRSFDDLGRTLVHVRPSSSYYEHLERFNRARRQAGKSQLRVRRADERLEDDDLLDMVDKGAIPAVIVDSHWRRSGLRSSSTSVCMKTSPSIVVARSPGRCAGTIPNC